MLESAFDPGIQIACIIDYRITQFEMEPENHYLKGLCSTFNIESVITTCIRRMT